ncbi:hypothetical protein UY3_02598 [Chelonia mydas]|uniref:Uncharacterized protein n=1 Tax=Chelonia mydas TaxID=8469 RepID=M7BQK3_CHEMY|nr:hypothetical protein UY3_02598 [Chelonia mydas]
MHSNAWGEPSCSVLGWGWTIPIRSATSSLQSSPEVVNAPLFLTPRLWTVSQKCKRGTFQRRTGESSWGIHSLALQSGWTGFRDRAAAGRSEECVGDRQKDASSLFEFLGLTTSKKCSTLSVSAAVNGTGQKEQEEYTIEKPSMDDMLEATTDVRSNQCYSPWKAEVP